MRLNERTIIKGDYVILVPYEKCHVLKYHEWMKSEELQKMTASEPLSLEEEYKMQKSWRIDSDINYELINEEVEAMVGDTNIFLTNENDTVVGEIEIMIAEKAARGKGLGKEAVLMMLRYGIENLKIARYEAKIKMTNDLSIALFEKIGFEKISENKIFNEYTFSKIVTSSWIAWLKSQTKSYTIFGK